MLKFFAKILLVFAIFLPAFSFVSPKFNSIQAQPIPPCTISIATVTNTPLVFPAGNPITVVLDRLINGESYEVKLSLGVTTTPTPTLGATINTRGLVASGATGTVTFPGSLFTPETYIFTARMVSAGGQTCSPAAGIIITVQSTSPPGTPVPVPVPAITCRFGLPTTAPVPYYEGNPIDVGLSNLTSGESYEVKVEKFEAATTAPVPAAVIDTLTFGHVANGTTGTVTFPGSFFTAGPYRFTAKRVSAGGQICSPASGISIEVRTPFIPVTGKNPCDPNCETALGTINPTLVQFAGKIIRITFGLAGGIALILMVIGAIRVLTSSGDQQKLSGGREMITAALIGLLFLIFSVLILQFILENLFGFRVILQ